MKYNVYISLKSGDYALGNLSKESLDHVINAYEYGQSSYSLSGKIYSFSELYQINIFEINDETRFEKVWNYDERETLISKSFWQPKVLVNFGREITNEIIGNNEYGFKKGIKQIFNSNAFTSYFWQNLNPKIANVSRNRFDSKQYADAVEAAFKEINDTIKQEYKKIKGVEDDGKSLMLKVFSPKNPIFELADLGSINGQNIQEGYMHIFAGSMQGIRNPKAHSNLKIEEKEAIEKLFLASHLMNIFEDRK